jgi:hypothetical protein
LWDFQPENMKYLQNPSKQPAYRSRRDHADFLCRLKDYITCKSNDDLYNAFERQLAQNYEIRHVKLGDYEVDAILRKEHRKMTKWIDATMM